MVISHGEGDKHKRKLKSYISMSSLMLENSSTSNSKKESSSSHNSSARVDVMVNKVNVSQAEIQWVMKLMMAHFSYRSCLNISDLFKTMFPDSEIAKSFKLLQTESPSKVLILKKS